MRKYALAAATLLALAAPAFAVVLDADDVGLTGTTTLQGQVGGAPVAGLSGTLGLTFVSITGGGTIWNFGYAVDNTTSGGLTSELSGFGLNTTPNLSGATATGLYSASVTTNAQLSSGTTIDFCASAGPTCSGGASNGIDPDDPIATGTFSLIFASAQTSISLDAAFGRFQGITGNGFSGDSGIGTNPDVCVGCVPFQVPGPALGAGIPGMIAGALGLWALVRRRQRHELVG